MAACRRHAAEPTESVSGSTAQAVKPTTIAIHRLKCSKLIRPADMSKIPPKHSTVESLPSDHGASSQPMPAAELLRFLKQPRGIHTWTEKDLAKALKIGLSEAKDATVVLQLQGYIERVRVTGKWRITQQCDLVSGIKPARFTQQSVEQALNELRGRIQAVNEDPNADYKTTDVVAFAGFLGEAARVQSHQRGDSTYG